MRSEGRNTGGWRLGTPGRVRERGGDSLDCPLGRGESLVGENRDAWRRTGIRMGWLAAQCRTPKLYCIRNRTVPLPGYCFLFALRCPLPTTF